MECNIALFSAGSSAIQPVENRALFFENMARIILSKRQRFKIFHRDSFTCMYCGRTPEKHDVTLEVDHRISVKDKGGNEDENLITSCFDCNRGKRADSVIIGTDLEDTKRELKSIKERLEQIKYISKLKDKIKKTKIDIESKKYKFIADILSGYTDIFIKKITTRIKNQHIKYDYDLDLLEECLIITLNKFQSQKSFYTDDFIKYFHGVLNNKIN